MNKESDEFHKEFISPLKEISFNINERKIKGIKETGENPDAQSKLIKELDDLQLEKVKSFIEKKRIKSIYELFYSNNYSFFYGSDPTPIGNFNQMFLYEIKDKKNASINIFGRKHDFEWITAGKRMFHGILDFLDFNKTGAQTLNSKRIIFFNDKLEMYNQVIENINQFNRGEYMRNDRELDIRSLFIKQWGFDVNKINMDEVGRQYENSLITHEGAHLIMNSNLEIWNANFPDIKTKKIYDDESERFAILSQMAFGPLPAYTLGSFLSISLEDSAHYSAMNYIIRDMINLVTGNKNKFSDLEKKIEENKLSSKEELFRIFNSMKIDEIKDISNFICKKLYEPMMKVGNDWHIWDIDQYFKRIVLLDDENKPLNPLKVNFYKEVYTS